MKKRNQRRRLRYHPDLYLGEGIDRRKLDRIKKKLETKPLLARVCLLTLSQSPSGQLEIYGSWQLLHQYYLAEPPYVVGIASDRKEALELLLRIVEDCLQQRGDCSLKEYLLC